ncbi:MAG: hypothetical protein HY744_31855 [Deltaproteobacteria bacterium]|nr:hypothetical protein [Deltaproteobacteria bacterium]
MYEVWPEWKEVHDEIRELPEEENREKLRQALHAAAQNGIGSAAKLREPASTEALRQANVEPQVIDTLVELADKVLSAGAGRKQATSEPLKPDAVDGQVVQRVVDARLAQLYSGLVRALAADIGRAGGPGRAPDQES